MDFAAASADPICAALRLILHGLRAALGGWGLQAEIGLLLYKRVGDATRRIERMLVRFRAGKVWRRAAVQRMGSGRKTAGRGPALPRRFGWLVRQCGWRAAGFGSQLQTVLQSPDMAELLAVAPQAGRILRPLCRALAFEWPLPDPKPEKVKTPRIRKPRPKPEPYKIPLPRGALSWARREGFKGI
jgi:hypothetical protein